MINPQLPLAIQIPHVANFDVFVSGENGLLIELLKQSAEKRGELQVYCWSGSGLGKTHLLQAGCQLATSLGFSSCYLPFKHLIQHSTNLLDNLESVDLLCLDELEVVAGESAWEQALFSLINRCRARQARLVFAASANINELPWILPDLASRLSWGPIFQIHALKTDSDKLSALQLRARHRGMELSEDVGNYLLNRHSRSTRDLCGLIDDLDHASLAAQRRLTIPFIKSAIEGFR